MTYTKTLGAALLASVALTTNAFACENHVQVVRHPPPKAIRQLLPGDACALKL